MNRLIMLIWLIASICSTSKAAKTQEFYFAGPDGQKLDYIVTSPTTVSVTYTKWKGGSYNYSRVVIPEKVNYKKKEYSVTGITKRAFMDCRSLTEIVIPNSVKYIGYEAFRKCNLTEINLPDSIEYISSYMLAYNPIRKVVIPQGVKIINNDAFLYCTDLTEVVIPNSVTRIEESAFAYCKSISRIHIPNSVTIIERCAFEHCYSLEDVHLPNVIKEISEYTFRSCKSLKKINIPMSVEKIGFDAFAYCTSLELINGLHDDIQISDRAVVDCPLTIADYKNAFVNRARNLIVTKLKEWQKKRDYETLEQYQARVTNEKQQQKTQELLDEIIKAYTKEHALSTTIERYDADRQLFTINSNYGKSYVKVPLSEAPAFQANINNAGFDATYSFTDDGLQIKELTVNLNGKQYYSENKNIDVSPINSKVDMPDVDLSAYNETRKTANPQIVAIDHTIDKNIPTMVVNNNNTFAIIIGNEKYTKVAQVPYASNDAKIFAEYCKKTIGLPAQNVRVYDNATFGTILSAIADVRKIADAYQGNINVVFYYAGHGIPNESTKEAYLLPVDADGQQTEACYPVSRLYKELGALKAKNVVVFMDACFSGAQRGEGMLASARGVALKTKAETPQGNMVVFSAASGDETAYPYKEKGHGLFTYFLLKKLQESKGDCTLGELGEYIQTNVRQQSVVVNRKSQTPTVVPSTSIANDWKNLKLR